MIPFLNNSNEPQANLEPTNEAGPRVKVGGVIADGKGGFFEVGDTLPEGCDLESLAEKGLI